MIQGADSSLVQYLFWVKNFTPMSNKVNKKIIIHHQAGASSPEKLAQMFNGSRQASSNYGISNAGIISQMVREKDRAWTTGSVGAKYVPYPDRGAEFDRQGITIEVANSSGAPNWNISPAAYNALVALCADICIRNNIIPSYDGTINASILRHNMFANTTCPGPTIEGYENSGKLVKDILAKMGSQPSPQPQPQPQPTPTKTLYKVQAGAYSNKASATKLANKIKKQLGVDTVVVQEGSLYKVQCGAFSKPENAEATLKRVKTVAKDAFIKEVKV